MAPVKQRPGAQPQGDQVEIADTLYISLKTVKAHIYNSFQKTGVSNRTQLAQLFPRS
ncbi:helix-turn-helix transcriptional regulator [bacterium]|nr:helix-turn-helix transcriptional regulator [bacterium]